MDVIESDNELYLKSQVSGQNLLEILVFAILTDLLEN